MYYYSSTDEVHEKLWVGHMQILHFREGLDHPQFYVSIRIRNEFSTEKWKTAFWVRCFGNTKVWGLQAVVDLKEPLKKQFPRFQILDLLFHTNHLPKSSSFLNFSCQRTRISKVLTRRQVLQSEVCNFSILLCKYGPHKHSYTNLMDLEIEAEEM